MRTQKLSRPIKIEISKIVSCLSTIRYVRSSSNPRTTNILHRTPLRRAAKTQHARSDAALLLNDSSSESCPDSVFLPGLIHSPTFPSTLVLFLCIYCIINGRYPFFIIFLPNPNHVLLEHPYSSPGLTYAIPRRYHQWIHFLISTKHGHIFH